MFLGLHAKAEINAFEVLMIMQTQPLYGLIKQKQLLQTEEVT